MIEYIYFVKCPNCEDEPFEFFDKAKEFALGCLSQKPIITQTEVNRNDFGECTDSCDLGTVWSWEDMMDTEKETTEVPSLLTKDFLNNIDVETDSEFDNLDNSIDFEPETLEVSALDNLPDNFCNPIESKHDELAESSINKFVIVGENEDYSKQFYNIKSEEWVAKSDDATLFDDRNEAILTLSDLDTSEFYTTRVMIKPVLANERVSDNFRKPIPEGMTLEQLVEEMEENEDTVECAWCEELADKDQCKYEIRFKGYLCPSCIAAARSRGETLTFRENNYWDFLDETLDLDIDLSNCVDSSDMEIWGIEPTGENTYKAVLLKKYEDVPFQGTDYQDEIDRIESEMFELGGLFVFHFGKDGLPILGRWDPELRNNLAGCDIYFADSRYEHAVVKAWGPVSRLEELEEAADYRNHLTLCPECGADQGFDKDTGFCIECGFNFESI